MRRLSTAALAIFIALVFLTYMVTYTVRYDEVAILTTLEEATEPDAEAIARGENSGSVIQEPGLYFKWPWPIQRVEKYPTRLQILQDQPEEIQLPDGNTVIVNMAVTWRVENPLEFFRSLGTVDKANLELRPQMSDLRSVISQYRFDQFVNQDADQIRLSEIEDKVAEQFRIQLASIQPSYGIEIVQVSMGKLLYNESTAGKVNELTTATQGRRANDIRDQGATEAETIINEAESASNQILAFADQVAEEIKNVGRIEQNQWIAKYAQAGQDPEFAIFMRAIEAAEAILQNKTKFILDARSTSPFNTFLFGPGEPEDLARLQETASRPTPLRPEYSESVTTPSTGARP